MHQQGSQKRFAANRSAVVFADLRRLVLKSVGLSQVLQQALAPIAGRVQGAFVYGSLAKGEDHAQSDLDLLIWSDDLTYGEVVAVVEPAEAVLGRKVNPSIFSQGQWQNKRADGNAFVSRVALGPRIWLIGKEH